MAILLIFLRFHCHILSSAARIPCSLDASWRADIDRPASFISSQKALRWLRFYKLIAAHLRKSISTASLSRLSWESVVPGTRWTAGSGCPVETFPCRDWFNCLLGLLPDLRIHRVKWRHSTYCYDTIAILCGVEGEDLSRYSKIQSVGLWKSWFMIVNLPAKRI